MRKFELNEKVARFTETKECIRIKCVIQNSQRVIQAMTGLEPMLFMYLWRNMTKNQFAMMFNAETGEMYGYVSKNENGIPQRYIEPEHLTFEDMYEVAD